MMLLAAARGSPITGRRGCPGAPAGDAFIRSYVHVGSQHTPLRACADEWERFRKSLVRDAVPVNDVDWEGPAGSSPVTSYPETDRKRVFCLPDSKFRQVTSDFR